LILTETLRGHMQLLLALIPPGIIEKGVVSLNFLAWFRINRDTC